MSWKISSTKHTKIHSITPKESTQIQPERVKFKRWKTNIIKLYQSISLIIKKPPHSEIPKNPDGVVLKKITPLSPMVTAKDYDSHSKISRKESAGHLMIRKTLEQRPSTIDACKNQIRTLKSMRDNLSKDNSSDNIAMLKRLNTRINVLTASLANPFSSYNNCKLKLLQTESALDIISKKDHPNMGQLKFELELRKKTFSIAANTASKTNQLTKREITDLGNHPQTLAKIMSKAGLKVTARDIIKSMDNRLNLEQWHNINNAGSVTANGKEYNFQQQCTPACRITLHPKLKREGDTNSNEKVTDIFQEDYQGRGVTSNATKNTTHATNMFTSRLINQDNNKEDLAIVRHGTLSPYGIKEPKERGAGALNRAKEVVIAALSLKPELLERAYQGEAVNLLMTSNSLLTPDSFRKIIKPIADEKKMLKDQMTAYKALNNEKPLTLNIKTADGKIREIRINLDLIPFNFGVNTYAVNSRLDQLGGWAYSDSVNSKSIQRLMGSTKPGTRGGIAGRWLRENEGHPNAAAVSVLIKQVQEIYNSQAHRSLKGGAYKMTSRLIALTWMIGGVPSTNCKSGKDRTAASEGAAHALIAYYNLFNKLPEWDNVNEDQSHLVKEFFLQTGHHQIQSLNIGAPGFKIQTDVLKEYGMNESEISQVQGLSNITGG